MPVAPKLVDCQLPQYGTPQVSCGGGHRYLDIGWMQKDSKIRRRDFAAPLHPVTGNADFAVYEELKYVCTCPPLVRIVIVHS